MASKVTGLNIEEVSAATGTKTGSLSFVAVVGLGEVELRLVERGVGQRRRYVRHFWFGSVSLRRVRRRKLTAEGAEIIWDWTKYGDWRQWQPEGGSGNNRASTVTAGENRKEVKMWLGRGCLHLLTDRCRVYKLMMACQLPIVVQFGCMLIATVASVGV